MKVQALPNGLQLRPQVLSGRDTPHVTLETNTSCNIRCSSCYVSEAPMVKPAAQVVAELDLALGKRRLETVSLLGGEPTLHPHLVDIVRAVKARGLLCQVLTNGVRFLYEERLDLLDALVEAGVDRFLLHVDSGQAHVHGDIDAARHALMDLLDARQVWYGLSLTLYEGEEHDLPRIMRDCARHPFFDGALVTLALDFEHAFDPPQDRLREPQMAQVASAMQAKLDVLPAAYLPSNLDRDEVCWLMWFYWINVETGRTAALSPALNRLTKSAWRRTHDTEFFGQTLGAGQRKPGHTARLLVATALAEGALHPGRVGHFAQVGKRGDRGRNLRFHYVVVQQAPRVDPDSGRLQICWQCPDATIRNGLLTPVCIAGRINPMGGRPATAPRALVEEVFAHLGEAPPPEPAPPESAAPPSAAS